MTAADASHRAAAEFSGAVLGAADRVGDCRSVRLAVGDAGIDLRFASEPLARQFLPAFNHLVGDAPGPHASMTLWDAATGAPPLPALPWPIEAYRPCGEIAGYSDGPCYIHFDVPMQALTVFDPSRRTAAYYNRDPAAMPRYETAGPLRYFIHRFALDRGMALVHAGAAAHSGRAALIVGPKGAGKSTTVLACLAAGLDYLGDDRCLLRTGKEPRVYSMYSSVKIFANEAQRHAVAGLQEAILPPTATDHGKGLVYIDRVAPARVARSAQLHCIVAPAPTGAERSKAVRQSGSEALRLLIAEIIGRSPVTVARSLAMLKGICETTPFYRLEAGRHLPEVASAVARLLEAK